MNHNEFLERQQEAADEFDILRKNLAKKIAGGAFATDVQIGMSEIQSAIERYESEVILLTDHFQDVIENDGTEKSYRECRDWNAGDKFNVMPLSL